MQNMSLAKWIGIIVGVLFVAILLGSSIYVVSPGYRGVLVTLGHVDDKTYESGIGFKAPFISSMKEMDIRTIAVSDSTEAFTSDMQTAKLKYTLTLSLVPSNVAWLYENVGEDYREKKIDPFVPEVVKNVTGTWPAQDIVNNRVEASRQILNALQEKLDPNLFRNITFSLTDVDYSKVFEDAIEAKVVAEQDAQKARNTTIRIEEEAKQKLISAKAEAEAMRIKSRALAENKSLVEYEAVLKWNGQLPQYMMGNSVPFINLK